MLKNRGGFAQARLRGCLLGADACKVNDISPEIGSSTREASNGYATKLEGVLVPPSVSSVLAAGAMLV